MKYNLSKFTGKPFIKTSLDVCKYPVYLVNDFKKSFDNLPYDTHFPDQNKTRQRRCAHYNIDIENNNFSIKHQSKKIYRQNNKKFLPIISPEIEKPYDLFIFHMIQMASQLVIINHHSKITKMSVNFHQIRQICYPGIDSHNSMEGIYQGNCDYIISACVLNKHNICGAESSVYNLKKDESLFSTVLEENEFIFHDCSSLYNYVTPVKYLLKDSIALKGYRDIIGIDINVT